MKSKSPDMCMWRGTEFQPKIMVWVLERDFCLTVARRVKVGAGWVGRGLNLILQPSDRSVGATVSPRGRGSFREVHDTYAMGLDRTGSQAMVTAFHACRGRRRGPARDFKGLRSLNRGYIRAHRHPRLLLTKGTGRIHRDPGANRVYLHQHACGCVTGDQKRCSRHQFLLQDAQLGSPDTPMQDPGQ